MNSEAALQHDGNTRELLRRMKAEEQLANALGVGNSGRDMRAEIADVGERLKRIQGCVCGGLGARASDLQPLRCPTITFVGGVQFTVLCSLLSCSPIVDFSQ